LIGNGYGTDHINYSKAKNCVGFSEEQ